MVETFVMETLSSILGIGNVTLFVVVFMALAMIPVVRTRRESRRLREHTEKLERAIERLELEKDVYNPGNHSDLPIDKSELAEVSRKYTQ